MNFDVMEGRLQSWSRLHAAGMLCVLALGFSFAKGVPRPLIGVAQPAGVFAAVSFIGLIVVGRGNWTPGGAFGWANGVTALRLGLVLIMALGLHAAPGRLWGLLSFGILLLDGLDGRLARITGSVSRFGGHFDMETDALFVAVLGQELWQRGVLGVWILIPGLLRYVYVLFEATIFSDGPSAPGSSFGKIAFVALVLGLGAAFLFPDYVGASCAWVGSCWVGVSYGRSLRWSWAHRAALKSRQPT